MLEPDCRNGPGVSSLTGGESEQMPPPFRGRGEAPGRPGQGCLMTRCVFQFGGDEALEMLGKLRLELEEGP